MDREKQFLKDFGIVKKKFPDLRHSPQKNNFFQIKGDLPIYDANEILQEIFSVKIVYSKFYPKGFAELYEVGGEIERSDDWHKSSLDQCCVCSLPEAYILSQKSNDIMFFVREYAVPFFVTFLHKKRFGFYPNGEYAHGEEGTIQWYREHFPHVAKNEIFTLLEGIVNRNLIKHYELCFCGSGKKLKKCHLKFLQDLLLMPKQLLIKHLFLLKEI